MSVVAAKVDTVISPVSPDQARRIALAAQGFGRARVAKPGIRQINLLLERIRLLQLDSVNVFERSHYLPVFARLGTYPKADLDRLTFASSGRYTEYWAHVASIIPTATWPLWRWKMEETRARQEADPASWIHANRGMIDWLRAELADKGPLPAGKIEHDANHRRGTWWEWSDVKIGLEHLFGWGDVVSAGRTRFERVYGLAEQVLPRTLLSEDVPKHDALRQLLSWSAQAHGIGTAADLADYFRIKTTDALPVIRELVSEGELVPVTVRGWERGGRPLPVYLHRDARVPRRVEATALLSPFDPVVWQRDRALRLFDFHYRIEIYTPEPKRIFGYYTLPVLVDDRLVARVDLKSDLQKGVLRVQAAWNEKGLATGSEARIAALVREAAAWQGLDGVEVVGRGDLAPALAAELGVPLSLGIRDIRPEEVSPSGPE